MTRLADELADRTGLGEAMIGALVLGAATSLSGTVVSVVAASQGRAELAVSNALGGIAAQTVFLAVADLTYRHANLEHAAASMANVMQAVLLIGLLAIALVACLGPELDVAGLHPASLGLVGAYVFGFVLVQRARNEPMWRPRATDETRTDEPAPGARDAPGLGADVARFAGLVVVVGCAGWALERAGVVIIARTGLPESVVGELITAVTTSLPELVTTLAAVRRGALTLAIGGIIGGNAYDVLFLAMSDAAYRDGSIYHAVSDRPLLLLAVTILMTSVLILGMLRRERHGIANIGFESFGVLVIYACSLALLFWAPGG